MHTAVSSIETSKVAFRIHGAQRGQYIR